MKLLKLLSNTGFISCNKAIARLLGLAEAILLGELCSISEMFGGEEFYFSQEKISNDTTLSEYQICNALKHLKDAGVLNITKKGLPCRNFYSINEDKIVELLDSETSSQKIKEQTSKKIGNSCPKNSGTFNNKNTKIRIQNKNTSYPVPEPFSQPSDSLTDDSITETQPSQQPEQSVHNFSASAEKSKTTKTKRQSFPRDMYNQVIDRYNTNLKKINPNARGMTYEDSRSLWYGVFKRFPNVEDILAILDNGMKDNWVVNIAGYSFKSMFGSSQALKLLNGQVSSATNTFRMSAVDQFYQSKRGQAIDYEAGLDEF